MPPRQNTSACKLGIFTSALLGRIHPALTQKAYTTAISCQGLTLISGACEDAKKAALFPANFATKNEAGKAAGQLV
jgi:hypothetical protein